MNLVFPFAAACIVYCAQYLIHCVRTGQKKAATGAAALILAAAASAFLLL